MKNLDRYDKLVRRTWDIFSDHVDVDYPIQYVRKVIRILKYWRITFYSLNIVAIGMSFLIGWKMHFTDSEIPWFVAAIALLVYIITECISNHIEWRLLHDASDVLSDAISIQKVSEKNDTDNYADNQQDRVVS